MMLKHLDRADAAQCITDAIKTTGRPIIAYWRSGGTATTEVVAVPLPI